MTRPDEASDDGGTVAEGGRDGRPIADARAGTPLDDGALTRAALEPPFVTADLPGIGGRLRSRPEHFVVVEEPLYAPSGEGHHVYLRLVREGAATRDIQRRLAELFDLQPHDVGLAGLKDKHARVEQTFSLHLPNTDPDAAARRVADALPVEVLGAGRHGNKLRRGHLVGNRFEIVISEVDDVDAAVARAATIASALADRGLPNHFGPQRFGMDGGNVAKGRALLEGRGPRMGKRWLRDLLVSAYQSALFNAWLGARMTDGLFAQMLEGDVVKKTDTGGVFVVRDLDAEQPRFARRELTYTGPIFGRKMRAAEGPAGAREQAVVDAAGVSEEMWRHAKAKGGRRVGRLLLDAPAVARHDDGVRLSFALPKGSYATVVLREVMEPRR